MSSFDDWFRAASGFDPLPYQGRLANTQALPELLEVPTGLGKTEAVFLAWLWRRSGRAGPGTRDETPRRLVWCLPMRALVEQTADRCQACVERLRAAGLLEHPTAVHRLLGGAPPSDWADQPEADAVLVGTQDMLLSRALNRGYAASRYRWPREFGLLHNDCQWVFDELQLMGVGRTTSAQLEAFRREMGTYGRARSLWMSATLRRDWLETVDYRQHIEACESWKLNQVDRDHPVVRQRLEAPKTVRALDLTAPSRKGELRDYASGLAQVLLDAHQEESTTVCVLNTVERAMAVHESIVRIAEGGNAPEILLLHSRFRSPDRARILERLMQPPPPAGRIAVCTQVVEAGLDLSARTLITELAPWSSLVQRFGRCNRRGEHPEALVAWCGVQPEASPPYAAEELAHARDLLRKLESAAPADLPRANEACAPHTLLRQRTLLELCDTDPDLCGADLDISRYIREATDHDLSVFWRQLDGPLDDEPWPDPQELCPVPVGNLRQFLIRVLAKKNAAAFLHDPLEGCWTQLRVQGKDLVPRLVPGRILLLEASLGGYDPERGWTGRPRPTVPVHPAGSASVEEHSVTDDPRSFPGTWVELADHTDAVVREAEALLDALEPLELEQATRAAVLRACRWHDAGKAHPVFQDTLIGCAPPEERARRRNRLWAKAAGHGHGHARKGLRHELASGLAALVAGEPDLVAYLAAAHHGKVRMAIRSLPIEEPCAECRPGDRFARGIHDHDVLPQANLGGGVQLPATRLHLDCMEMGLDREGRPSWQDRALSLLEELGPFRLTFLEALVRVADARGSASARSVESPEACHA